MATPLLQKARQRKMIYFGAIVALFGLSLMHREFVVKPQATRLQLRETARGEVELTSSAVRLMLTGSRGLAVTFLWYTAMDKQKRGEYHELELIVASITKLQPYFITPWLFQSWNIAFNVAVECDRPRDKYYFISRGLELAAEGERRNSGTGDPGAAADPERIVIPGNPELRHFMGFIYQLKIGGSDERLTMRSLLEMSCIDPVQRDPKTFLIPDAKGKGFNTVEFTKFAQKHPRLIRRLHEQLGYNPQQIVQFLQDHLSIPNRFKPITLGARESELKDPLDQFPILPPHEGKWPNTQTRDLTSESIDVFLVCRTWYEYAQQPLPPPDDNPRIQPADYDKLRYRVPKGMVTQLFRQYPARAQVFIAETLESEGFFDSDGWNATEWFKKLSGGQQAQDADLVFGSEIKYHSRLAWQRGYEMYKEFGVKNGIYISPGDSIVLNKRAELIRAARVKAGQNPGEQQVRPEWREGPLGKSLDAEQKLYYSDFYRRLANYDSFLYQAEGEGDPVTVSMRKLLFKAERERKRGVRSESALDLYAEAWTLYGHACFKYPRFAQVSSMQEDLYEIHQRSLRVSQDFHAKTFKAATTLAAKLAYWQVFQPAFVEALETDQQEMNKILPIRQRFGLLDLVHYYDGPAAKELKEEFLFRWVQGASMPFGNAASALTFPGHEYFLLTRTTPFLDENPPAHWRPLITKETRRITGGRLGLKLELDP
jgi:hypothetical protein